MTTKTKITVDDLLHKLATHPELPSDQELLALSDMDRAEMRRVRGMWSAIPEERRFRVVDNLVKRSYDDLQLHLHRLLRIALEDESDRVRCVAVRGLWEDTSEELVGPLIQMLHNDPSHEVRAEAAAALGRFVLATELGEMDASLGLRLEEALLSVLHSEGEILEVQRRALESIAYSGEAGIRELIEDAYYSPYEEMRVSALVAMGRSADTRWRGAARAELESTSADVRAEAARTCGELEARAATNSLIELLDDEDLSVRLAAIFALGRIGGKEAQNALQAVILEEMPEETDAAKDALEEMIYFGNSDISLFGEEDLDLDWDEGDELWDSGYWDRND